MSEACKRFLLAAGAVLVAALVADIGLRVFDVARGRTVNARAYWYWLYEQDPYLGWRGVPRAHAVTDLDDIRHDDAGFRDARDVAELVHRGDGKQLVVCVGESSTYGISAGSNDATYPAALERELRSAAGDDGWIVLNAGMPGYTSHEVLTLIDLQLLKLHPDIIVEMNLANDHDFMALYLDEATDYDHLPVRLAPLSRSATRDLLMRSSLVAFIASRLRFALGDDLGGLHVGAPHDGPTSRGLKLYRDNLAMTALLARRSGVRLMLVDQPIEYSSLPAPAVASLETVRGALRNAAQEEGVPLLEAHAGFDWRGLSVHQLVHLGRPGYERLAKRLAPQILAAAGIPDLHARDAGR
ncbi:MAG: SGNH/GDSL hydrolase family protein [Acidobacteria bacterium]|nr:SGNH/GDSL hydrolase family protein [Acidobacteriota bacterium]